MRTPQSLAEAKAAYRQEKGKIVRSASALAGSRWVMAVLATLVIAFATGVLYSPHRLPAIGGLSLSTVGLPPLDFGVAGEQAAQAREAAERQGAQDWIGAFLAGRPDLIPLLNGVGLALTFALLVGNMWIMTKRRRVTRG